MTSLQAQTRIADAMAEEAARAAYDAEQKGAAAVNITGNVPPVVPLMNPDGMPTPQGWRKIGELFRKEMSTKEFKGKGGREFSYITARQVAKRLDDVVGPGNWQTQVQVIRAEHPVSVLVGLGVMGVWKWDAGYSNNPEADDEADRAYEQEPLKAAVSDGFKRAAVLFGIGRWLYGDTP